MRIKSRATVYRLINSGQLRTVNIANSGERSRLRIPKSSYDEFIARRSS
ncbi:helix-turn-helix domain-containing protein [Mycetocola saprophilus]|nr:helix-turn-helix domain-containing protein [Mycetocola saprophilus]